jgi:hypothetical protein
MMQDDDALIATTFEADTLLIKQYSGIRLEDIEYTELREAVASAYVRNLDQVMEFIMLMEPTAAEFGEPCTTLNEAMALYQRLALERDTANNLVRNDN